MTTYENKRNKTKNNIINSTIKLGKQFGLANVNISGIIREASINRSTFYRYFTDKQELFTFIQDNILNQIKTEFKKYDQITNKNNHNNEFRMQFVESFLDVIDKHHEEIKFLISTKGTSSFNYALANMFIDLNEQRIMLIFDNVEKKNKVLYANYFGLAIIGIIKYWIDHYEEYTKQDIINFLIDLNSHIEIKR